MTDFQFVPPAGSITIGDATYDLISLDGLGQTVNSNDQPSIAGGVVACRDSVGAKMLTFTVEIFKSYDADAGSAAGLAIKAFADAWASTNTDAFLTWTIYGLARKAKGRTRNWATLIDFAASRGVVRIVGQFFVPSGIVTDSGGTAVNF